MIIGTIIMYSQIKFMLNKDIGFNKEQLLVLNGIDLLGAKAKSFKETVRKILGVNNITFSAAVPGRNHSNNAYWIEGKGDESFGMATNWIDYDFLETFGMPLVAGRSFTESYATHKQACLINETAAKTFGISATGQARFMVKTGSGKMDYLPVIGVVKNFSFESFRNQIGPYVFMFKSDTGSWGGYITIKLSPRNNSRTINDIENAWKEYAVNNPLNYYFIDEDFEHLYITDKQNAQIALISSILAIFIASLGLFGLISFTVEQRTKEIGVRKVMGSLIAGVYATISKEVIILISISSLIACPIIYLIANNWLKNFYYKIDPGFFSFLSGFFIALGIAILTISYKILSAARKNPAQSLKYE